MFAILWKNKPLNHDTLMVNQVWFENSKVFYTIDGVRGVSMARVKDIDRIVSNELRNEIRSDTV